MPGSLGILELLGFGILKIPRFSGILEPLGFGILSLKIPCICYIPIAESRIPCSFSLFPIPASPDPGAIPVFPKVYPSNFGVVGSHFRVLLEIPSSGCSSLWIGIGNSQSLLLAESLGMAFPGFSRFFPVFPCLWNGKWNLFHVSCP